MQAMRPRPLLHMVQLTIDERIAPRDKFAVQMNGMKEVLTTDQPTDGRTLLKSYSLQSKSKARCGVSRLPFARREEKIYDRPTDGHTLL